MNREILTNKTPASFYSAAWREATPLGNGHIGASVYGYAAHERILINHEDLWVNNVHAALPDVSDHLPLVRRLLQENRFYEAQNVMGNALKEKGYHPVVAVPMPLCDILIETPVFDGFTHYSRRLDMARGEATIRYFDRGAYVRRCFVSRADGAFIMEMTGNLRGVTIALDMHDPLNATKPFGRGSAALPTDICRYAEKDALFFHAAAKDAPQFGATLRMLAGEYVEEKNTIVLLDCHRAVFALIPCVSGQVVSALNDAYAKLKTLGGDYAALFAAHAKKHAALFGKCTLDLGSDTERSNEELLLEAFSEGASDELFEKMYAFARHLMISACDDHGLPCSLLGLWHGDYHADWALNMLNENIQMTHWQALSGNLPQLLLPLFDYYDALMDDFRENARKIFGCRGIFVPSITTPGIGLLSDLQNHMIHWTAGGAWLAQHYYHYYLFTRDVVFLEKRAIPFMEACAAFYLDYFTLGEDGYYLSSPCSSPENTPGNFEYGALGGSHPEVTMNATMDFATVKELLTNLISASSIVEVRDVQTYREALTHIPPYQANEDGAIREWMHPYYKDRYEHRHQSHIYPFFPGKEIQLGDSRCDMIVKAIEMRMRVGLGAQSSWSLAHMAHVWARLGRSDEAYQCLNHLLRCFVMNNLFTVHNDWRNMGIGMVFPSAPFQIDANMGFASAMHEMLLQSDVGKIALYPALPHCWKRGSVGAILAHSGIEVTLSWENGTYKAVLRTPVETEIRLTAFGVWQGNLHLKPGCDEHFAIKWDEPMQEC